MDIGAATFSGIHGAERAFSSARERDPGADWIESAALVEVHRQGRLVVRGSVAGHYVDIDGETRWDAAPEPERSPGPSPGSRSRRLPSRWDSSRGPASAGSPRRAACRSSTRRRSRRSARREEGSSAVVVSSGRADIRAMFDALLPAADTFVHYSLEPAAEAELRAAVAEAPVARRPNAPRAV